MSPPAVTEINNSQTTRAKTDPLPFHCSSRHLRQKPPPFMEETPRSQRHSAAEARTAQWRPPRLRAAHRPVVAPAGSAAIRGGRRPRSVLGSLWRRTGGHTGVSPSDEDMVEEKRLNRPATSFSVGRVASYW